MVTILKYSPSPSWILFASGNSVKVEISLYDPAVERSRPIEAYMVSDVGTDLARSASRAAEAIYAIAHTAKIAPPPTVVGYDLQGLENSSHIAGQSSGLALALALAKKFWPDADPGPIAATGEIASSSNGGPLHKIAEIQAKGEAVLKLLPDGGYFFYPKDNATEISETLKQAWREKKINARAVNSVAEALAFFIPEITEKLIPKTESAASITVAPTAISKEKRHPATLLFVSLLVLIALAAGLLYTTQQPRPQSEKHKSTSKPAQTVSTPAQKTVQTQSPKAAKNNPVKSKTPRPALTAETGLQTTIPKNIAAISLSGTSGLADRLARRMQTRLQAFIDSEERLQKQLRALSGRIEMIEIRERWDPQTETLSSTVTSAFHGQAILADNKIRKIDLAPITVSGTGSMRQQLTNAATLMVERISKELEESEKKELVKQSNPTSSAKGSGKGFE